MSIKKSVFVVTFLVLLLKGVFVEEGVIQGLIKAGKGASGEHEKRSKLADGCYHVFLDCGSNVGVHGRFLFEPHKYPKSKFTTEFNTLFGANRTKQNVCVFAFEPNPMHKKTQSATQSSYAKMGWRYHYMPFGVSDTDGKMTFYRNYDHMAGWKAEEWGFSIHRERAPSGRRNDDGQEVVVDIVDLARWTLDEIQNRSIPEKTLHNNGPPVVAMKIDVEGSEFRTLMRMYRTGAHKLFQSIVGEKHFDAYPQVIEGRNYSSREDLQGLFQNLSGMLAKEGGPAFRAFDDEEYLHDRMVYPDPANTSTW